MEKYMDTLKKCPLFADIGKDELQNALKCLLAKKKRYKKNSFVFMEGDDVNSVGIVMSGGLHIIQEDFWGNRAIIARAESGDMFGEAFSCAEMGRFPLSVIAVRESEVLLVDARRIVTTCPTNCAFHTRLIQNMLRILAGKNVMLTQKIGFLTKRTTREKLLAYLSAQAKQAGSNSFTIPFNRQELAEYLSVDRSAMSNELSKMQKDGILTFHRNQFKLIHNA